MSKIVGVFLVFFVMESHAQFIARDTLNYADSSRVTTTWSAVYIGPKGIAKYVSIALDTTDGASSQTVLFLCGAASDTNNRIKINVIRLRYNRIYNSYPTLQDTLRMKTLGGTVASTVIVTPIPPIPIGR